MNKKTLFFAVAILLTLVLGAKEPYKAGDYASDFKLKSVDGKMVSLSQFESAKGFILVFSCNTCPVVKQYEQRIIDLDKEFSSKGYPVVAINSNDIVVSPGDSYDLMKKLAKEKDYKFPYLYDESQAVAKEYGATNTPHVYILSKRNDKLEIDYVGAIDNNAADASKADKHYVQDAVNALLSGGSAPIAGTKAIGCTIKWKKATP